MTIQEAFVKMREGHKMTHTYFSPDEWVTFQGDKLLFEDDVTCTVAMFLYDRMGEGWKTGWSFYIP
jgi:hypothetical protein